MKIVSGMVIVGAGEMTLVSAASQIVDDLKYLEIELADTQKRAADLSVRIEQGQNRLAEVRVALGLVVRDREANAN